jgi:hypothetical protein
MRLGVVAGFEWNSPVCFGKDPVDLMKGYFWGLMKIYRNVAEGAGGTERSCCLRGSLPG